MKKKFIAVSMVLGALALSSTTLTSCVDDNESASVTKIRDAKAQQLTALANYQQAQADAEQIIAEAEAAIKNAIAEAKKIENESSSVDLEIKKATLATDIETATAKAEANLLTQQALLAQAKAELLKVEDAVDLMTKEKIKNLIAAADAIMNGGKYYIYETDPFFNYETNQWEIVGAEKEEEILKNESLLGTENGEQVGLKYQLIEKKADKANAEYELTDTKLKIAEYVRKAKLELAKQEALLAEYQTYSNTDKETAQKAADEAASKLNALQQTKEEAQAVYKAECKKITAANTAVEATEVEKFFAKTGNDKYDQDGGSAVVTREYPTAEIVTVTFDDGTTGEATPDYSWNGTFYNAGTTDNPNYEPTSNNNAQKQIIVDTEALAALVTSATRTLEVEQAKYDAAVEKQTEGLKDAALIKDATDYNQYDFINQTLDFTTATYKDLKDATADAQKAYDKDQTQANRTALENAEADEATYVAYFDVDDSKLEKAKKAKAAIDELNTLLTGDAFKAYTTAYEAYIAAHDASVTPATAVLKAKHNYEVQQTLIATLNAIATGYTDWAEKIYETEIAINTEKQKIANITDNGSTSTGNTEASKQAYIDALDAEITRLEKEISIKESMYKYYMDQVEALIQGEEAPAVPETPAEGEETPAE